MNSCQLLGRICNDLELKTTQSGISVMTFNIAIDRYMGKDAEKKTDFISCVAWRTTAEHIAKFWHKGDEIAITGSLQSRTYEDQNGTKHYITEVIIDRTFFTHGNKKGQPSMGYPEPPPERGYSEQPSGYSSTQGSAVQNTGFTNTAGAADDEDYPF